MNSMLLEGDRRQYHNTLARCNNALDIKTFVPGHGPMAKPEAFYKLIAYLRWLLREEVDEAIRLDLSSTAAIEAITLDQRFLVSRFSPASRVNSSIKNFHRVNVLSTCQALPRNEVSLANGAGLRKRC